MKAIFLDAKAFRSIDFSAFSSFLKHWEVREETSYEELIDIAYEADILVVHKLQISKAILDQLPNLKLICEAATGMDNIDLIAAKAKGIEVYNVANYSTESVANLALSFMLSLSMRLQENRELLARGDWEKSSTESLLTCSPFDLEKKKLGIIGYGAIGQRVATLAKAFGMEVLIANGTTKEPHRLPLKELLEQSDMVSLHCPLTSETHQLIGEQELKWMSKEAILINVSRGKLVDGAALERAIVNEEIFGAGVDVLECEPPKSETPLLHLNHPRLLVTPHIGWGSQKSLEKLAHIMENQVKAFVEKHA